jgi:hypothetical protein
MLRNPVSVKMSGQYELASLRLQSPHQSTRSRSSLDAQLWHRRVPVIVWAIYAS